MKIRIVESSIYTTHSLFLIGVTKNQASTAMMNKMLLLVFFQLLLCSSLTAQTVRAADFGYQSSDATAALINAINSSADTIIVGGQETLWRVGSMHFWNLHNKTIVFEPGVVIEALPGRFNGYSDCLFRFANCNHINLIGYGATFQMHKQEYAAIDDSEYRHSINLYNSKNVTIKGLTLLESGGDGIAIDGRDADYCEHILIEDVRCLNHYRQGMSIMNVHNMTVRHSEFSNTAGILPEAGIDIEPYQNTQRITNLLIDNCRFEDNGWSGIAINLFEMDASSMPVGITVRDCVFKNNCRPENNYAKCEIYASDHYPAPVQGEVLFERCLIEASDYSAFYARKSADAYVLTFKDCAFQNVSQLPMQYNEPISLEVADYSNPSPLLGGIHFDNVLLSYPTDFSFFRIFDAPTLAGLANITGHFTVVEPNGNSPLLGSAGMQNNISFTYSNQPSLPPTTVSIAVAEANTIECTQQAAEIVFARSSTNTAYPLGISYELSGTAVAGADFHFQPLGIVLPTDSTARNYQIVARNDEATEPQEILAVTLQNSSRYELNQASIATINFSDCSPLSFYNDAPIGLERLILYPNPAADRLFISMPSADYLGTMEIYDAWGRLVKIAVPAEHLQVATIDVQSLASGIYFLLYKGQRQRFIKQ